MGILHRIGGIDAKITPRIMRGPAAFVVMYIHFALCGLLAWVVALAIGLRGVVAGRAAVVALPVVYLAWHELIARARRRYKPNPMECVNCQYNLTGNVSGVCPECGTALGDRRKSNLTWRRGDSEGRFEEPRTQ